MKGLEILFPLGQQPMIDALYGLNVKETMGKPYPKHPDSRSVFKGTLSQIIPLIG
jgi:hypothetical protein